MKNKVPVKFIFKLLRSIVINKLKKIKTLYANGMFYAVRKQKNNETFVIIVD